MRPAGETAAFVGGFVAAEGCFLHVAPRRFAFAIALGATDERLCRWLPAVFGVGTTTLRARRREHYQDEITYRVDSLIDLVEVIVPFMDEHLPPSHKRRQYLVWRTALLDYWEHGARRRR